MHSEPALPKVVAERLLLDLTSQSVQESTPEFHPPLRRRNRHHFGQCGHRSIRPATTQVRDGFLLRSRRASGPHIPPSSEARQLRPSRRAAESPTQRTAVPASHCRPVHSSRRRFTPGWSIASRPRRTLPSLTILRAEARSSVPSPWITPVRRVPLRGPASRCRAPPPFGGARPLTAPAPRPAARIRQPRLPRRHLAGQPTIISSNGPQDPRHPEGTIALKVTLPKSTAAMTRGQLISHERHRYHKQCVRQRHEPVLPRRHRQEWWPAAPPPRPEGPGLRKKGGPEPGTAERQVE